jgi:hypothetical protein
MRQVICSVLHMIGKPTDDPLPRETPLVRDSISRPVPDKRANWKLGSSFGL